ncbi:MAG: hypothetical protein GXO79_08385 [Chlorobi bacterium]|nr:hypothetical protein [Chlorobiota bacterium]
MENKLEQYKSYYFTVKKTISLPAIGKYYVMQSPFGSNHLMPVEPYKDYNIKTGQNLKCYIDKINCTGKIFLEPEHPYYKRDEVYNIFIIQISDTFYKRGKYRFNLLIEDYKKNRIEAIPFNYNEKFVPNQIQKCKVIRLKKGKLVLSINI